tara:strand:- start:3975 stop:4862 length:888 start_codon:yes stop_codon:yes gene_type:complete
MSFSTNAHPLRNFSEGEMMFMVKHDITTTKIDPFKLLEAKPISLKYLLEKYNKLKILNHPDKGGLPEHFVIICDAIQYINEILKSQIVDRQFFTLRENAQSEKIDIASIADKVSDEHGNFDNNKFNQFFEMYKFDHGNNDKGYGEIMNNDKDIPNPEKINFSEFQQKFRENKKKHTQDIVEYQVPKAHNSYNSNGEILGDTSNNFTGKNYTDYYQAFNEANLINDDVDITNKSVKQVKEEREDPKNLYMTNEQSNAVLLDTEEKQRDEWNRQSNYKDYVNRAQKYHNEMTERFLK